MTIPSVNFLQSPYQNARDGRYPLRAFVNHRIVGTLPSARRAFGLVAGDVGRRASSHFGIGYVNGVRTIDQYVPLDRMAWTNGDVREPTWSRIIPGVNPNLYTVTIEHEDGSYAGRGVVSAPVWEASVELQDLLVSGDAAAIRAKGIRGATDSIVAQMKAIPNDSTGFIDHHQIAGPNKPYCFRRWLDDPGFVEGSPSRRDRLLAFLDAEDDDMASLKGAEPIVNRRAIIGAGATVRSEPAFDRNDYDAHKLFSLADSSNAPMIAWVQGTNLTLSNGSVYDARTRWAAIQSKSYGVAFVHERDVVRLDPIERVEVEVIKEVPTGITRESYAALQQQGVTALKNIGIRANADAEALAAKKP